MYRVESGWKTQLGSVWSAGSNTLCIVPSPPCLTVMCAHLNTQTLTGTDFFYFSYRLNDRLEKDLRPARYARLSRPLSRALGGHLHLREQKIGSYGNMSETEDNLTSRVDAILNQVRDRLGPQGNASGLSAEQQDLAARLINALPY